MDQTASRAHHFSQCPPPDVSMCQSPIPGFSSCIVAAPRLHPCNLMTQLLPLLQPSAFFVVLSPTIQPLAECMHEMQQSRQALNLQLHESWMRPYQVCVLGRGSEGPRRCLLLTYG